MRAPFSFLAAAVLLMTACSRDGKAPLLPWKDGENLLANASFEEGRDPWQTLVGAISYWNDFSVSPDHAYLGTHSALLSLTSQGEIERGVRVWGLMRDVETTEIPRKIAGTYRVENWTRGTEAQYIQAVIALNPPEEGFPRIAKRHPFFESNRVPLQLAWVLCGIKQEPYPIESRKVIFAGPREPAPDKWIKFEFDIHEALLDTWGAIPSHCGNLRVYFEARFDGYHAGDGEVSARVYFDDLFLGGK